MDNQTDQLLTNVQQSISRYATIRKQTEAICQPLQTEDYVLQPIVDVSPPKWHLGHTTWFFETVILEKYVAGYQPFNETYPRLFNSYYNAFGDRVARDQRGFMSRPTVDAIYEYRHYVNEHIEQLLSQPDHYPIDEIIPLIELGLNHEQQHQELLVTDIKYILFTNYLRPAYHDKPIQNQPQPSLAYLQVNGGIHHIGYAGNGFCYDNEQPIHKTYFEDFALQNRLTTNKEYLEFINDKGYSDFRFWLSEGWDTVQGQQWSAPLYWKWKDGQWFEFTLNGLQPLDLNAPVTHISYYEAEAFATWKKLRLPTEFEWEVAAKQLNPEIITENNLEDGLLHPTSSSVDLPCTQLFGHTWEWTASAYLPYPGYKNIKYGLGEYNGKFMINQMVLKGASCATPTSHIRTSYRNFFHPDKRWQFTGIRLAKDL